MTVTQTVPQFKRADQLATGDHLAAGFSATRDSSGFGPARVLFVVPYTDVIGRSRVSVVIEELDSQIPQHTRIDAAEQVLMLTEADQAEARKQAERAQQVAEIRAFADFLDENPWLPVPNFFDTMVHLDERHPGGPSVAEAYARVHEIAERLGEKVEERLDDRSAFRRSFGTHLRYEVIAWHPEGRPAKPEPEPVADPTGLTYSRVDTEPDDPTPVSPARGGQPHVVAVTDGGLVDETPAEEMPWPPTDREMGRQYIQTGYRELLVKHDHSRPVVWNILHGQALAEDHNRLVREVEKAMTFQDAGRVANPSLARFLAEKEDARRKSLIPAPLAAHYETDHWCRPGDCGVECACGRTFSGFSTCADAGDELQIHAQAANAAPVSESR